MRASDIIWRLFGAFLITMLYSIPTRGQTASDLTKRAPIVYQSPHNGDTYVPRQTSIVIRPAPAGMSGHTFHDFSFDVRGELSGVHSGKIVISDDKQTIIFKPYQPFSVNEHVDVVFSIGETISPLSFGFRTTPFTDQERLRRFNLFKKSEEIDNTNSSGKQIQNVLNDTSHSYDFLLDTLSPSKVAPGNIFTTRNDSKSYIENFDDTGSRIYEFEVFNPPSENFRPWNNSVYSYNYLGQVFILDSNHAPIDTFRCGNGYITDDHEFQLLPNGHAFLMAYDDRDTDMRLVTGNPNAATNAIVVGSIIQELDIDKNVVFQWRTWDYFDINDVTHTNLIKPNPQFVEYSHLNSIEQDHDGNIIASFRALEEVTKINRKTGDIIWRWGGKNNAFQFIGDTIPFSYQHEVRRIPNGHITMMDNGDYHSTVWGDGSKHDTAWSRAIEYDIDETAHTARAVWQYSDIDFTVAAGSVQRLPNGNTFICSGPFGIQKMTEVTLDNEKVFEMKFPAGAFSYRAYRFPQPNSPLAAVRLPGIICSFGLQSIYPNPAHESTTIAFSIENTEDLQIDILNVLGQNVLHKFEKLSEAGQYSSLLDLNNLPAGIYYCKLTQGGNSLAKELVIQK